MLLGKSDNYYVGAVRWKMLNLSPFKKREGLLVKIEL